MRLIDADALKRAIEQGEGFSWDSYGKDDLCVRKKYIDNAPTVETKTIAECIIAYGDGYETARRLYERPQGEWNYIQAGMAVCPFCGASPHKDYKNFCAKCGARLVRGGEKE